ncbi:LOW QUALITY PROTEIN: permease [Vibrio sp. JCM 18905]|nr:LOW QUALITY PROTEIN: permease [Vibrio sp. JCM 18905]
MFHSSANPIIRLVFTPILLLFYLQYSGAPTPFIAPIFVVIFLTLMPSKPPPFNMMLKLLVILSLLSFGIVTLAGALMSSPPSGFLLFTWSLLCWSYYRSHRDPKDIVSTLTLIVVLIIVVTSLQMGVAAGIPWVLFTSFIVALVATYISFWLFPGGDEKDIQPDQTTLDGANEHIGLIVFKATALCVVLYALISSGSSQTLLIAITFGSMIKHPINQDSHSFGRYRIITTSGSLFTIPCMLAVATGAPTYVVLGVTIFCGLQLACFAIRRQTHLTIYQLLFTNFTVLTYQIINNTGIESFSAQMTRFVSISIAIVLGGVLVLNLFRSEQEVK